MPGVTSACCSFCLLRCCSTRRRYEAFNGLGVIVPAGVRLLLDDHSRLCVGVGTFQLLVEGLTAQLMIVQWAVVRVVVWYHESLWHLEAALLPTRLSRIAFELGMMTGY